MDKLRKILLVDDDNINNFINKVLLEKMKIAEEITVANNAAEGIKCLVDSCFTHKISPELILLDLNMPGMDGFDFINTYHSFNFNNKRDVTIAILSTSTHYRDKERMSELGIHSFITKPLTEDKVRTFIRKTA